MKLSLTIVLSTVTALAITLQKHGHLLGPAKTNAPVPVVAVPALPLSPQQEESRQRSVRLREWLVTAEQDLQTIEKINNTTSPSPEANGTSTSK